VEEKKWGDWWMGRGEMRFELLICYEKHDCDCDFHG
jgi:hypothetical protein